MSAVNQLSTGAAQLGVPLSDVQLAQFDVFARELMAWNERFNLTTIIDPERITTHHFLDSLSALPMLAAARQVPRDTLRTTPLAAIDVGSGPGLPGLALKLAWPCLDLTLLEGTGKKVTFLKHVIDTLTLDGVRAVHGRAEELAVRPPWRAGFDLVMARAVAPMRVLVEYLLPLARVGGWVMAYKGAPSQVELDESRGAITLLGGRVAGLYPIQVPGLDERRSLVLIYKEQPTPHKYPRASGVIRSRPLAP
jgi:16S rRNA (guanine527-N7)-methyltransferase